MHKVLVTQFAKDNLNFIYSYYKSIASLSVADRIKNEIKEAILTLKDESLNFQEDDLLVYLGKNHRRLVCGNYKIIYYRDYKNHITFVTDIFDSRQDPEKEMLQHITPTSH